MCLERRLWVLASSLWPGTTTTVGIYRDTLPTQLPLPKSSAELRIQFRRTAKMGAVVLGAVYLLFALRSVPQIFAQPRIYNSWGNFFEQFSLVAGAAILYARLLSSWSNPYQVKRLLGSAAFLWASVPFPLASNRRFIWAPPPLLFRSGFRQLKRFGRKRPLFCSRSRRWPF